jgi:hypothetical protein
MKSIQTLANATRYIQDALVRFYESGVDLVLVVKEVEDSNVWLSGGFGSFQTYLTRTFPNMHMGYGRYRNVVKAIELHGEKKVRELGMENAVALSADALFKEQGAHERAVDRVDSFRRDNGYSPEPEWTRRVVRQEARLPEQKQDSPLDRLRAENAELKAQLASAKRRIRDLEIQVTRSEKQKGRKASPRPEAPRA